jgi:hypothetical protein
MMKVAFYKVSAPNAGAFDKLISFYTNSIYSHAELIFSTGLSFSSSIRDGGCRYKAIGFDPVSWDYISLPYITPEREVEIKKFCNSQNGKGYDYVGLFLTQVFPFDLEDPNRWFCTEIVARALGFTHASSYNPKKLNNILKGVTK